MLHNRGKEGRKGVRNNALRRSEIRRVLHYRSMQQLARLIIDPCKQIDTGVDDPPAQIATQGAEKHGTDLHCSVVATPRVQVKVRAIMVPNRTSDFCSNGSSTRFRAFAGISSMAQHPWIDAHATSRGGETRAFPTTWQSSAAGLE